MSHGRAVHPGGPLLSLGCSRDAPHSGEWRLLLQARKGGLDAAWRSLPIGPGTRRSGVRACKVSLKEEKRASSGEPEQLGSGEAAERPVGGHGGICTVPGFSFLTEVAAVAPLSALLVPAQVRAVPRCEDGTRIPHRLAARPRRVGDGFARPVAGPGLALA